VASPNGPTGAIAIPFSVIAARREKAAEKMNQSYLCRVLRGRYRAAETRLRG